MLLGGEQRGAGVLLRQFVEPAVAVCAEVDRAVDLRLDFERCFGLDLHLASDFVRPMFGLCVDAIYGVGVLWGGLVEWLYQCRRSVFS